jgi:hypothetical protein
MVGYVQWKDIDLQVNGAKTEYSETIVHTATISGKCITSKRFGNAFTTWNETFLYFLVKGFFKSLKS